MKRKFFWSLAAEITIVFDPVFEEEARGLDQERDGSYRDSDEYSTWRHHRHDCHSLAAAGIQNIKCNCTSAPKNNQGLRRLAQAPEWCKSVWPSVKKGQATLPRFNAD